MTAAEKEERTASVAFIRLMSSKASVTIETMKLAIMKSSVKLKMINRICGKEGQALH